MLNSFLSTPHGKLQELAPLHTSAIERDPHVTTSATLSRQQLNDHVPQIIGDFAARLRAFDSGSRAASNARKAA